MSLEPLNDFDASLMAGAGMIRYSFMLVAGSFPIPTPHFSFGTEEDVYKRQVFFLYCKLTAVIFKWSQNFFSFHISFHK